MLNLSKFVGKKVIWVGRDKETELDYIFFEGFEGLCIEEGTELSDGRDVAFKISEARLEEAKSIVKLNELLNKEPMNPLVGESLRAAHNVMVCDLKDDDVREEFNPSELEISLDAVEARLPKGVTALIDSTTCQLHPGLDAVEAKLPGVFTKQPSATLYPTLDMVGGEVNPSGGTHG
jgi:hypothetical protein